MQFNFAILPVIVICSFIGSISYDFAHVCIAYSFVQSSILKQCPLQCAKSVNFIIDTFAMLATRARIYIADGEKVIYQARNNECNLERNMWKLLTIA